MKLYFNRCLNKDNFFTIESLPQKTVGRLFVFMLLYLLKLRGKRLIIHCKAIIT